MRSFGLIGGEDAVVLPQPSTTSRVAGLMLRLLTLVFLIIALVILTTDALTLQFNPTAEIEVRFVDVYSYRYMLGAIVIGVVYTLFQIAKTVYRICARNRVITGDRSLLFDFFADQIATFMLGTGAAAAFGATVDLKATFEGSGFTVNKFFDKGYAASSFVLFAFITAAIISVLSSFSLPKRL